MPNILQDFIMSIDKIFIHGIYCELATTFNETKEQSCTTFKLRFGTLATKLYHSTNLIPTIALLKETFRGTTSGNI